MLNKKLKIETKMSTQSSDATANKAIAENVSTLEKLYWENEGGVCPNCQHGPKFSREAGWKLCWIIGQHYDQFSCGCRLVRQLGKLAKQIECKCEWTDERNYR